MRGKLAVNRLDLGDDIPAPNAAEVADRANQIRGMLVTLAPPAGVNAEEQAAMIALINRVRDGVGEPLSRTMVEAAARDVIALEKLHDAVDAGPRSRDT